ncbi:MAG: hypothetical protein WC307_03710 [Candidatus Nanoarchaeia archaeon]|jgi:hypothetical protein
MNYCFNHCYFSSKKLVLFNYELGGDGRAIIQGKIGLPLKGYTNTKGINIFEPLLGVLTERLNSLASVFHNSDIMIKNFDYEVIKHPLKNRVIPNVPELKTYSYNATGLRGDNESLLQSFTIKSDDCNYSKLEETLMELNDDLSKKVIAKLPRIDIRNLIDYPNYQSALSPYFDYFSSKIFHTVFDNNNKTQSNDSKWQPVACGHINAKFKKQLYCLKKNMLRGHLFDVQELRKQGIINSKIMWDGVLENCPHENCNEEILPLPPYVNIENMYISSIDDKLLKEEDIFQSQELIKGILMEGLALGDTTIQLLTSIYNIELQKRINFEGIFPYLNKIDFIIGKEDYRVLFKEPSNKQLIRTGGLIPYLILKNDSKGEKENVYKSMLKVDNQANGNLKTKLLAKKLFGKIIPVKKII